MTTSSPPQITDVTIIGAGPTGLAAAYYAGHREASVRIIDTLQELGGQVMAIYPEKHIFDVAGHPKIKARDLCDLQAEQALQFSPEVILGENCETLELLTPAELGLADEASEHIIRMRGSSGREFLTRTVIITAGHGAFEPRKLPVEDIDSWEGRGLHYFVKDPMFFEGKKTILVGGGDSALDWTLALHSIVEGPLGLVHRRERFRGLEHSVTQMRALVDAGEVQLMVPSEVTHVHGKDQIESVTITTGSGDDAATTQVECDALVTLLGFKSQLGSIADWNLDLVGRRGIRVDPATMETNLPSVFAAGDVAQYEGKITLITIGMGEAAIAANRAITKIRPDEKAQPKYSTE